MDGLDAVKFSGEWYEIAHTSQQLAECNKNAVLVFSPTSLTSKCFAKGKLTHTVTRKLTRKDPNSQSKMTVSSGLASADLWIYYTDYTATALLGDASGNVWILSRQPSMAVCAYMSLVDRAGKKGLNTDKLQQDWNVLTGCSK